MDNIWAIIPNRIEKKHQGWLLKKCLESLFDFEPSMAHKVVICDDISPDQELLKDIIKNFPVKLIQHKDRVPYSKMINAGFGIALQNKADAIITINNDIEHRSVFLDHCKEIMTIDEKIQVIGPLLFYPDGKTQHSGVEVSIQGGSPWCEDHYRGKLREWSKSRYCHHVAGAWQFIRLKGLNIPYDNRFLMTFEDVDFCLKLWEQDKRTYFTDKIFHIHHESVTRGKQVTERELASIRHFKSKPYNLPLINNNLAEAITHQEKSS